MSEVRKYIIIPEYKALYAMRKCYGPTHGPLTKPCPTPIDIIGELLKQRDRLTIYEVKVVDEKPYIGPVFSDPVQLNLDNYMLPYDKIASKNSITDTVILDEDETISENKEIPNNVIETVAEETGIFDTNITEINDTVSENINYSELTRSERRSAAKKNNHK